MRTELKATYWTVQYKYVYCYNLNILLLNVTSDFELPAGQQRSQWKKSLYCRRSLNKNHTKTPHSPPSGTSSSSSFSSCSAECVLVHTRTQSGIVPLWRTPIGWGEHYRGRRRRGLWKTWTRLLSIGSSAQGGADDLLASPWKPEWKPEEERVSKEPRLVTCILYHLCTAPLNSSLSPPSRSSVFLFCPNSSVSTVGRWLWKTWIWTLSECRTPRGRLVFLSVCLSETQADRTWCWLAEEEWPVLKMSRGGGTRCLF